MKRVYLIVGFLAQFALSQAAYAATVNFSDTTKYWDGWKSVSDPWQNTQDVLGKPQITGGSLTFNSSDLLTKVSFYASPAWIAGGWNLLESGDLFINVKNSGSDHTWDYIVRTFNSNKGGNYALYDVTSLGITDIRAMYGAQTHPAPGFGSIGPYITAYDRDNQPVALQSSVLSSLSPVGTVYFAGLISDPFSTSYSFANGLDIGNNYEIAWGLTCGNDVVQTPVPEPGTMALFGAGLLGLVVFGKRRMSKEEA